MSYSEPEGPRFYTWSGHILSFPLWLIQEGSCQLLGKVCTDELLRRSMPAQE